MNRAQLAAGTERLVNRLWYAQPRPWYLSLLLGPLVPLSLLHGLWHRLRPAAHPPGVGAPVIVVGNLTAGGNGKTPLVLWLVAHCRDRGLNVGVVSRGVGGHADPHAGPVLVNADSSADQVGDEALLLAHSGAPVAVYRRRADAARVLVAEYGCELIVADDGLQHRALPAAVEIVMIDAVRGFGNGWLLPAGPLREPATRLESTDMRIGTGGHPQGVAVDTVMQLRPANPESLDSGAVADWSQFRDRHVHALAGIGHPQRFFDTVLAHLPDVECHAYPDHFAYQGSESPLNLTSAVVLTTSKDAVRLRAVRAHIRAEVWVVPVRAELEPAGVAAVDVLLSAALAAGL